MKKLLSLFLAVMMVASIVVLMPVFSVSAAEPTYDGDSFDPTDVITNKTIVEISQESLARPTLSNNADSFGNSSYAKLFDGNHSSKIEGNLSGTATLTFQTTNAAIVTDYVIYTGNDNVEWPGRNPASWVLKGTTDGVEWVVLDSVSSTGLDEANSTPYGYKIDNPDVYKDYRIEFTKGGGYCQICELVLYTDVTPVEAEDSFVTYYKDTHSAKATFTLKDHGLFVGATFGLIGEQAKAEVIAVDGDTVSVTVSNLSSDPISLAMKWDAGTSKYLTIPVDVFANTETAIGFVQLRPNSSNAMTQFDVRIIVEALEEYIKHYDSAKITAIVEYGVSESRTFEFNTTTVYKSIQAGNEILKPSDGCLYFGGAITGIPNGDYNVKASLTLTVDGEETEIVLSQDGNDVSNPLTNPADNTVEATNRNFNLYGIENHAKNDITNTYVVYNGYDDVDAVVQAGGKVVLNINGTNYYINDFNNYGTYWGRLNAEVAGAEFLMGASYTITMYVYDANYKMVYYTDPLTTVSPVTASNTVDNRTGVNVTLPEGLGTAPMDTSSATVTGITTWGDGAASNLIDGNTSGSKIGGNNTSLGATITVTFKTTSAVTATYYTLYTGGDTASNQGRNPLSWKLYGKVGNDYVLLSDIGYTLTTRPGIEPVNRTPYSYQIENPQSCTEYKIEFIAGSGQFQMNELVLHTGN